MPFDTAPLADPLTPLSRCECDALAYVDALLTWRPRWNVQYYKAGPIAATSQKYRVVYADNGKWGLDIHTSEKMWEAFYTVDPTVEIGHGLNEANLLGGESAVWTVTTDASILSPVLWPRLLAVGEKLWSPMADTATVTTSNAAARMAWARCELNRRGIPAASSLSSLTPAEVGLYGSCLLQ